jgi:hypothetical protein
MPAFPTDPGPGAAPSLLQSLTRGAAGVGLILVLLPTLLLFFGVGVLQQLTLVGLPLMAIFGIMILFGSLAMVATLYRSLGLTDRKQPLALPEGSIRAAIALSLIVLFAIISIMLFQGMSAGTPVRVDALTQEQRNELVAKAGDRLERIEEGCATPAAARGVTCPEADRRFAVYLRTQPAGEATDLAKQLLVLVGTLMTSVTSYYFAARGLGAAPGAGEDGAAPAPAPAPSPAASPAGAVAAPTPPAATTAAAAPGAPADPVG